MNRPETRFRRHEAGARTLTQDDGNHEHRHPDRVAYLKSLTESEAAVHPPVICEHGGGFTQYWLEDGKVRSRDITEGELLLAGFRPDGGSLPALLAAVSAEFGPQLPKLAANLASGALGQLPRRWRGGAEVVVRAA